MESKKNEPELFAAPPDKPAMRPNNKKPSETTSAVTARFFQALRYLVEIGAIKNKSAFMARYNLNRCDVNEVARQFPRYKAQIDWLVFIARDYGVSGDWLLFGRGRMIRRQPQIVITRKKPVDAKISPAIPPVDPQCLPIV